MFLDDIPSIAYDNLADNIETPYGGVCMKHNWKMDMDGERSRPVTCFGARALHQDTSTSRRQPSSQTHRLHSVSRHLHPRPHHPYNM